MRGITGCYARHIYGIRSPSCGMRINTFSFHRIDRPRLAEAAIITTVKPLIRVADAAVGKQIAVSYSHGFLIQGLSGPSAQLSQHFALDCGIGQRLLR